MFSAASCPFIRRACASVVATLALAACGAGGTAPAPGADSQIAAQVNKDEISVHQVQHVLQRQPRLVAERPEAAARKVLDSLVEQELAAQAAREQGLERDPAVLQAMQVAQREVLARAWQDKLAAKATGPSSSEIDRYYDSHPALFSQRRLYTLQEVAVEAGPERLNKLREVVAVVKGAPELVDALRSLGLRPQARQFVQASEELPLGLLDTMAELGIGQSMLLPQAGGARIVTVLHTQSAPVDRHVANDAIAGFLHTERRRQAVVAGMKTLRDTARIQYVGSFAQGPGSAASAAN